MTTAQKNAVLATLAELLKANEQNILSANQRDITACVDTSESMLDRLKVNSAKISGMISALNEVIALSDPEGKILHTHMPSNGLEIQNRTVPFGKILIIYESRPDVTIEATALAFKAGNKVLLKGGKEARITNLFLVGLWQEALTANGLSKDLINYLDFSREETQDLIKNNSQKVDLIIPRGGPGLISFVTENTTVPVIVSGRGNNFLYIDSEADFEMAIRIAINGKQRISVCNALDKVLIHKDIPQEKVNKLIGDLKANNIEVLEYKNGENEELLKQEFLAAKILLSRVESAAEAIEMINKYSGRHSASIVTTNKETAEKFQNEVDCAAVYHNASTRFTDGGQFGYGAEIAISTQKLHGRGPIGINQLVTNKWFIYGNGQIRT